MGGQVRTRRWVISEQSDEQAGASTLALPLVWRGLEALPVLAANELLVQVNFSGDEPDSVLLTIGYASPPPLIGTSEERWAAANDLTEVAVRPVARFSVTKARARAWAELLAETVEKIRQFEEGADDH